MTVGGKPKHDIFSVLDPVAAGWLQDPAQKSAYQKRLVEWGQANFRPFPWRQTHDPYPILLAEVMLHRTQVVQVVPVFEKLIQAFPSLKSLILADREEIKGMLTPLGLTWRIDLIESMLNAISKEYAGQIPQDKKALMNLPGLSEYIAGAVRCFAWNEAEILMDTNTVRIVGKLFNLPTQDSSRRNPIFYRLLEELLDREHPRSFNYALLDLAHLICLKKQTPICHQCPVLQFCQHGQNPTHFLEET